MSAKKRTVPRPDFVEQLHLRLQQIDKERAAIVELLGLQIGLYASASKLAIVPRADGKYRVANAIRLVVDKHPDGVEMEALVGLTAPIIESRSKDVRTHVLWTARYLARRGSIKQIGYVFYPAT
jgi:hypothetical protein